MGCVGIVKVLEYDCETKPDAIFPNQKFISLKLVVHIVFVVNDIFRKDL